MSGGSNTSASRIPFRSRLRVRFTFPLLFILAIFSGTMLVWGYFHVREQAMAGATAQIRQLAAFAIIQETYVRKWAEESVEPVVRALEDAGPDRLYSYDRYRKRLEASIMAVMPVERGILGITLYLEDSQGKRHGVRFRRGEAPLRFTPEDDVMRSVLLAISSGGSAWHTHVTEGATGKELTARYYTPIGKMNFQGQRSRFGVLTVDVAMSWLAGRIRAISTVPETQVFFMDKDGVWTLPEAPGRELPPDLSRLHRLMFARQTGQIPVQRDGREHVVAFTPLVSGDLMFGMFIPEYILFGGLDRMLGLFVLMGLALFVFALLFLRRTANLILRPVHELNLEAERLSAGNFSAEHFLPARIARPAFRAPGKLAVFCGSGQWPDEPGRLHNAATRLRAALGQRQRDLTLLAATRERLFGEIALAGKLQHTLRRSSQEPPESFLVAAELTPAGHIAHDVFDYFSRDEQTLYCITASAAAHGIPAALLMDRVLPLLHELLLSGMTPARALENANTIILSYASIDKKDLSPFVSVFIGAFSAKDGTLVWASAGKPPPYRTFAGRAASLPWSGDFPLGVKRGVAYHNRTAVLKPGETLLLCGNRLTAMLSPAGEAFGEDRLLSILQSSTGNPVQLVKDIRGACLAHANSEMPPEDIALLAVRWLGGRRS